MDDIDVTSSMGRNRPCMFDVVEAATMLASNGTSHKRLQSGGTTSRRAVRIGFLAAARVGAACSAQLVRERAAGGGRAGVRGGARRRRAFGVAA